jgi:hypothetical protein
VTKESAETLKGETKALHEDHVALSGIASGLLTTSGGTAASIAGDFDGAFSAANSHLTDTSITKDALFNDYKTAIDDNDAATTPIIATDLSNTKIQLGSASEAGTDSGNASEADPSCIFVFERSVAMIGVVAASLSSIAVL